MSYHIRVTLKGDHECLTMFDRDEKWIEEHIAQPRRQGRAILFDGRVLEWSDIWAIHIIFTTDAVKQARTTASGLVIPGTEWDLLIHEGTDVTHQFITGTPGTRPRSDASQATAFASNRKAVMVIYGHDEEANTALFNWLRAIGLQPQEWGQLIDASNSASPYTGQVLEQALMNVQAVIAFFTPDEHVKARTAHPEDPSAWRLQARPNVLIEAGMALVTHPTRTVIAVLGNQELPSDLAGRHHVRLNHLSPKPLHDLANRLDKAGCEIDLTGSAWLDPSHFPDRDYLTQPSHGENRHTRDSEPQNQQDNEAQQEDQLQIAKRAKEDYEARQVRVEVQQTEFGDNFVTVYSPLNYPIERVEVRAAIGIDDRIRIEWYGSSLTSAGREGSNGVYTFRQFKGELKADTWAALIRFVDRQGNLYYQYRNYTERFPINTDWIEALHKIEELIRRGSPP